MRHDAKLGLALGMLVIGFAVAFCFPRLDPPTPPKLETPPPPISETTLALLPIRAYQSDLAQPSPSPEAPQTPPPSDRMTPILIDGRPITAADLAVPAGLPSDTRPLPSPVPSSVSEFVRSSQTRPGDVAKDTQAPSPETYLVKPGDTLSGIATRLLGSSARYGELFAANRDQLDSPDDLKIGMRLRVPELIPARKTDPSDPPAATAQSGPSSSNPPFPRSSLPPRFQRPPPAPWVAEEPREQRSR